VYPLDDGVQLIGGRSGSRVKQRFAVGPPREHAIEDGDMELNVEVEARSEALHEVDRAAPCAVEPLPLASAPYRAKMASTKMRPGAVRTVVLNAARRHSSYGSDSTYCRTGGGRG
jgi:hypothetical protein